MTKSSTELAVIPFDVVLLDFGGCVLNMNRSAAKLLQRGGGLRFRHGHVQALSTIESMKLRDTIEAVVGKRGAKIYSPGGSLLISRNGKRPLTITVAPLRHEGDSSVSRAVAVPFIYDSEAQVGPPEDLLRHGYGLTPAEARLSLFLIEGHSLTEAAEFCGVTHHTVRSQLKSIFLKTGVPHQGELVRLLLRTHLFRQAVGRSTRQDG